MMSLRALGNLGSQGEAAKAASHYYGNAADYYLKDSQNPEEQGIWIGEGSLALGLNAGPSREELQLALAGVVLGKEVQNAGDERRQMGWDMTFSAPKSVSIAWASSDKQLRNEIEKQHNEAVREAFKYIETQGISRRGHGGSIKEHAQLIASQFTHHTSRAGDPQLHSHVVVPNICLRGDGTVGTLESKSFYDLKMTAGSLYQADLARRMQQLGYDVENGESGTFRLKDVSRPLEKIFSKRDAAIDKLTDELGLHSYAATRGVVLTTRLQKKETDLNERREFWNNEAANQKIEFKVDRFEKEQTRINSTQSIVDRALKEVTAQESTFQEKDLIRVLARQSYGSLDAQEVQRLSNNLIEKGHVVLLSHSEGRGVYSTPEMIRIEKNMIEHAKTMALTNGYEVDTHKTHKLFSYLSSEQKAALDAACGPSQLVIIQGRAGVGKTTTINAIRDSYEREGWKLSGVTIAGKAAETLQNESNIPSRTYASWSSAPDLSEKSVLIVDESGMMGSRAMDELLTKVREAKAKIILVGDEKQLQPIDAGGSLHAVDQEVRRVRIEASSQISTIIRQDLDWMKKAVSAASRGDTQEALNYFKEHDKIRYFESGLSAKDGIVKDYIEKSRDAQTTLILTHQRGDAHDINIRLRTELKKTGLVKDDLVSVTNDRRTISLALGDSVLLTKNDYSQDVRNGQRGVVTGYAGNHLDIVLDNNEKKRINLSTYNHIDYGWAVTTHKAQGATVNHAYVYGNSTEWMASQQATYVQLSRAKFETLLYVSHGEVSVDRQIQTKLLSHEEKLEAFEHMSRSWGRDASKGTTHDFSTSRSHTISKEHSL